MNILFTGGTGFFGKAFLSYWIEKFKKTNPIFTITILSRNALKFKNEHPQYAQYNWINFVNADILNIKNLEKNKEYTHIIHAAADSTNGYIVDPIYRFEQIAIGTKNILDYAVENNIKNFLLVSSGAIYGKNKLKMAIKESHNGSPDSLDVNNIYALSKKIAENITCIYSDKYEIRVVIARCFAFGGPDLPLDKHYALGNFINDILKNKEIIIKGTGNSIRSYMHQSELSEWLYLILINGKNKNVYNVGGKYPITIRELAEKIRLISRSKNNIKILNEDTINNEDIYYPDVSKFENEFGIKQVYSVENIIEEMLECAKQ